MSCIQTPLNGLAYDKCLANVGGIEAVYIAKFDDVSAVTLTDSNEPAVSAITMSGDTKFMGYHFREETGSLTGTLNVSDNGGRYYTNEANLVFDRMVRQKHLEISVLASEASSVLVKDNNGEWWLMSKDKPVYASANVAETSAGYDDHNGYNLTLSVRSQFMPLHVEASVAQGVIEEPAGE